jgi:hypothetical protein
MNIDFKPKGVSVAYNKACTPTSLEAFESLSEFSGSRVALRSGLPTASTTTTRIVLHISPSAGRNGPVAYKFESTEAAIQTDKTTVPVGGVLVWL